MVERPLTAFNLNLNIEFDPFHVVGLKGGPPKMFSTAYNGLQRFAKLFNRNTLVSINGVMRSTKINDK